MKYSQIINSPIVSIESGEKLGRVIDLVINYENGKCLALLIQPEGTFVRKKIVLVDDISSFGDDAVMVQNENFTIPLKSSDEITAIVKKDIKIVSNKAVTYSGDLLGEVKDYEFDEISFKLTKLFISTGFLKDLVRGELVVVANKIMSIGRDAIIVKDAVVSENIESKRQTSK